MISFNTEIFYAPYACEITSRLDRVDNFNTSRSLCNDPELIAIVRESNLLKIPVLLSICNLLNRIPVLDSQYKSESQRVNCQENLLKPCFYLCQIESRLLHINKTLVETLPFVIIALNF